MKVKIVSTPLSELLNRWIKVKGEVADKAVKCDEVACSSGKITGCLVEKVGCNLGKYYVIPIYEHCVTPVSVYEVDEKLLVEYDKDKN